MIHVEEHELVEAEHVQLLVNVQLFTNFQIESHQCVIFLVSRLIFLSVSVQSDVILLFSLLLMNICLVISLNFMARTTMCFVCG